MSWLGVLKGITKGVGKLAGVGSGLSAGSETAANNRGNKFVGQLEFARLMNERDIANARLAAEADNDFVANTIARETEGRAGRQDAWRKLQSAQRVTNPDAGPGASLTPYAIARRQPTHAETTAATALSEEVRNRLLTGNPMEAVTRRAPGLQFDPTALVDLNLLNAGKGEKWTGWLGALLQGADGMGDSAEDRQDQYAGGYTSPRVTRGMRF